MSTLEPCQLCPRRCGARRSSGERGYCGAAGDRVRVYRWGPHDGEEPPVSGSRGSGTVFFSHCTLACLYCQNYPWSQQRQGSDLATDELAGLFRDLAERGCHNWNLVAPTPWLPLVREALRQVRAGGLELPVVYNTSGFERPEVLEQYDDCIDVALTDLRYADPATAEQASGDGSYVEAARTFAAWAWRRLGPLRTDADGIAGRGLIVRLLVLPNRAGEAIANLEWLAETLGTEVAVSLMAQYTPVHRAAATAGWDRRVTQAEFGAVADRLEALGFENGWVQELETEQPGSLLGCAMPQGGSGVGADPRPSMTPPQPLAPQTAVPQPLASANA